MAHCVYGILIRHVFATNLKSNFVPANLKVAFVGSNPDIKYGILHTIKNMMACNV